MHFITNIPEFLYHFGCSPLYMTHYRLPSCDPINIYFDIFITMYIQWYATTSVATRHITLSVLSMVYHPQCTVHGVSPSVYCPWCITLSVLSMVYHPPCTVHGVCSKRSSSASSRSSTSSSTCSRCTSSSCCTNSSSAHSCSRWVAAAHQLWRRPPPASSQTPRSNRTVTSATRQTMTMIPPTTKVSDTLLLGINQLLFVGCGKV